MKVNLGKPKTKRLHRRVWKFGSRLGLWREQSPPPTVGVKEEGHGLKTGTLGDIRVDDF